MLRIAWCTRRGSNARPQPPEGCALPAELRVRTNEVSAATNYHPRSGFHARAEGECGLKSFATGCTFHSLFINLVYNTIKTQIIHLL